jgi:exonuclease VII small subunit
LKAKNDELEALVAKMESHIVDLEDEGKISTRRTRPFE